MLTHKLTQKLQSKALQLQLERGPPPKFSHYSFVVCKNNIISAGHNMTCKTHPWAKKFGYEYCFIHSELDAVRRFPFAPAELKRCILVNFRVSTRGGFLLAKPCQNCRSMLLSFGLREVWFTNKFGILEKL